MEPKWKIGFIVEGDSDKLIVEEIARRVLSTRLDPDPFKVHAVRLGSKIALPWAYSSVLALLDEAAYDHVVIVLDADSARAADIDRKKRRIEETLREHRLTPNEVSVCLAVPQIEAWLLAPSISKPEDIPDPKLELERTELCGGKFEVDRARKIGSTLDIEVARRRSPSFEQFVSTLEGIADKLRRQASAA